jgi:hypothetical protein
VDALDRISRFAQWRGTNPTAAIKRHEILKEKQADMRRERGKRRGYPSHPPLPSVPPDADADSV